MKVLKNSSPVIFIILLSIFLSSSLFTENYPAANSRANICILMYDTEFKKNLTAALVQDFNSKGISVTVDTVSNGSQYSAANYDVVILLSGMKMGSPLSKAVKYIKTNNYSSNIIYVVAHGKSGSYGKDGNVILDKNKIDVVTSASVASNDKVFDEVKNKIIEKVLKVLK